MSLTPRQRAAVDELLERPAGEIEPYERGFLRAAVTAVPALERPAITAALTRDQIARQETQTDHSAEEPSAAASASYVRGERRASRHDQKR